jgi:hypothetical protein
MSRSRVVAALTLCALVLGARSADDTTPAGYSVLKRAVERKFADVRARDHETHADDGYDYDD